jgi:hypothetical protein
VSEEILVPTLGKQVCHIVSFRSVFYQQFIGTNFGFHPGHPDFNMPTSLWDILSYEQLQG